MWSNALAFGQTRPGQEEEPEKGQLKDGAQSAKGCRISLLDALQEVHVEWNVKRLVPGQNGEHVPRRRVSDLPQGHAVGRRADGLEHEVQEHDRFHTARPRIEPVKQPRRAAHG